MRIRANKSVLIRVNKSVRIRVKKSTKIRILLPVAAGVAVGGLINWGPFDSPKLSPLPSSPARSLESSTPKKVPRSITHYLLTSQSLFSEAIALSRMNTDKKARMDADKQHSTPGVNADTNRRIVELINEAISAATQAIVHYPTDPRGWAQRGKIYEAIQDYLENASDLAISDYQTALKFDPKNPNYAKKLSLLFQKKNDLYQAASYLKIAAEASPTDAQIWFDLAQLQAKAGLLEEAYKNYKRILPLLADKQQKQLVEKEIKALEQLLAKVEYPKKSLIAQPTPSKELELIENPPLLEAKNLNSGLIIAESTEEKQKEKVEVSETNALSGNAIIPAGQTQVKIKNDNLTTAAQVYLTALGDTQNQVLRVKSKGNGFFVVTLDNPLPYDLEFKWWIIRPLTNP